MLRCICSTLRHTAAYCNTLQTLCDTLQHTATQMRANNRWRCRRAITCWGIPAAHCNALQHCNTLQHTAIHCNALQHTATHCNTLQSTATRCYMHTNEDEKDVANYLLRGKIYLGTDALSDKKQIVELSNILWHWQNILRHWLSVWALKMCRRSRTFQEKTYLGTV